MQRKANFSKYPQMLFCKSSGFVFLEFENRNSGVQYVTKYKYVCIQL